MNQFLDFLNKINKLETIKSDKKNYSYSKMQRQVQSQNNTIVENQVNISLLLPSLISYLNNFFLN